MEPILNRLSITQSFPPQNESGLSIHTPSNKIGNSSPMRGLYPPGTRLTLPGRSAYQGFDLLGGAAQGVTTCQMLGQLLAACAHGRFVHLL